VKTSKNDLIGWGVVIAGLIALLLLIPGAVESGPALLRVLFGWGAFAFVPMLLFGGIALAFAGRMGWRVRWRAIAFGEVFFVALLGLLHLDEPMPLDAALNGLGGGIVGWAVSQLLTEALGAFGARLVILAGLVTGVIFLWLSLPPDWTGPIEARLAAVWLAARDAVGALWNRAREQVQPAARADRNAPKLPQLNLPSLPHISPVAWAIALRDRIAAALAYLRLPAARLDQPAADQPVLRQDAGRAPSPELVQQPRPQRTSPPPEPEPVKSFKADNKSSRRKSRGNVPGTAGRAGLPPMDLLRLDEGNGAANAAAGFASADTRQRAQLIKQTLGEFGVPVEIVSIKEGPTVTQFGLEPGEIVRELRGGEVVRRRVSVSSILRLNNDLALALAAPSLRIEAPVPGRPYVGVEVPNPTKTLVSLRNILESKDFARVGSPLTVALGRDVSGDPVVADLTRMPHLLIAGATGSGKSVCVNAMISSLLMNNGPDTVRLLMVDPKMVELPGYNGIPHLVGPVITDPSQANGGLAWLMLQMDDRYRAFADAGVRNIVEYNRKMARSKDGPLPYLVLVIDELADLMMTAAVDIERQICRLAQMARATGIHLVLATQRPSVDVITGLIKANFPARIAFAVTSQIDSRVILDTPGAEKLLGRGDMLFMAPDTSKLARIQGCFVSDQEIDALVDWWKARQGEGDPAMPQVAPWLGLLDEAEEKDELLEQALKFLETKRTISTSLLQRQLRIGFPRAARLMEQLEEMGVVAPDEGGGRSRQVRLRQQTTAEAD